jgi:hypothetical protein
MSQAQKKANRDRLTYIFIGAGNGIRTRDLQLGNPAFGHFSTLHDLQNIPEKAAHTIDFRELYR